jgi:bacillithiol biosynthesis cysteine-adding enzyme BshC
MNHFVKTLLSIAPAGGLRLKSECLPFRLIPHTSRLFLDYLSGAGRAREFYPRTAHFRDWLGEEARRVNYSDSRRQKVAAVLERQNRGWGASEKTLEGIAAFRRGALAAVTGQQVGLFGGPAYSIYKALTVAKLAEEATAAGFATVPIFWLASEDHDLAEINHVQIPGPDFRLARLAVETHGDPDAPVGAIRFGEEIVPVVKAAAALLGEGEAARFLTEVYRPGETLGSSYARLFARIFADFGLILLDPSDAEFHQIAQPVYENAVDRVAELNQLLLARGRALEAAGYHPQVKVTPASTLLFVVQDGARVAIHRRANEGSSNFQIGQRKISQAELRDYVADNPQDFSPNALLRPVVQDYLLPTLAYAGGAAEIAYFAQVDVLYRQMSGCVTPILPRFSATLVSEKLLKLMGRYKIQLPAMFEGPEFLAERLSMRSLPASLQAAVEQARDSVSVSLDRVRKELTLLDVTLVDSARHAESKIRYQLDRLARRAANAEMRRTGLIRRHAEMLSHGLFPHKVLQEREVAGIYFIANHGRELLQNLYAAIDPGCLHHQVIEL